MQIPASYFTEPMGREDRRGAAHTHAPDSGTRRWVEMPHSAHCPAGRAQPHPRTVRVSSQAERRDGQTQGTRRQRSKTRAVKALGSECRTRPRQGAATATTNTRRLAAQPAPSSTLNPRRRGPLLSSHSRLRGLSRWPEPRATAFRACPQPPPPGVCLTGCCPLKDQ